MRDRNFHLLIFLIIGLCCGTMASTVQADKIVIEKSKRTMTLLSGKKVLKLIKSRWEGFLSDQNALKATIKRPKAAT